MQWIIIILVFISISIAFFFHSTLFNSSYYFSLKTSKLCSNHYLLLQWKFQNITTLISFRTHKNLMKKILKFHDLTNLPNMNFKLSISLSMAKIEHSQYIYSWNKSCWSLISVGQVFCNWAQSKQKHSIEEMKREK